MRRFLLIIIGIFFWNTLSAATIPFTDVQKWDNFYEWVQNLYNFGIISDDGSHLFNPADPINRDMFVSLATSVSCKKCLTPSVDDILRYQNSPFIDLSKSNPYYYCIAYANEKNIAQGYTLDSNGSFTCENGKKYMSSPFCETNKTTRIEAAAMLLRQAQLWDDAKNTGYIKKINITDINGYWQGYAEKWIAAGILTLWADNTIHPNDSISRGEFAMMAGKMLSFNQCRQSGNGDYSAAGTIGIKDSSGKSIDGNNLSLGKGISLVPVTSSGTWNYAWKAVQTLSGNTVNTTNSSLPIDSLGIGTWFVELSIIDPATGKIVSQPTATINIGNGNTSSVALQPSKLIGNLHEKIDFWTTSGGTKWSVTYAWDYGDGTRATGSGKSYHIYDTPGIYTVTLTVTDENGNVSQSKTIVEITGNTDSDGDGMNDDVDLCIMVQWPASNNGCPVIKSGWYGNIVDTLLGWEWWGKTGDSDGDGIIDSQDFCMNSSGSTLYHGCSSASILSGITKNKCLNNQLNTQGLMIATPVCNTCPCENSIDMVSLARTCDILFPAILSPDQSNIYARWGFYQIQ